MDMYKCSICGNVVSKILSGSGKLVCCNKDMDKIELNTPEKEGKEKHVPVIEDLGNGLVKVKVGSIPHPMEEKHFIPLIQLMQGDKIIAGKRLNPNEPPEAVFHIKDTNDLWAREYCNLHGLWSSK